MNPIFDKFEDLISLRQPGVIQFGGARMAMLDIEAGFWGIRRQLEALLGRRLTNSVLQQSGANGGASFAQSFAPTLDQSVENAFEACLQVYQTAGFGQFEITSLDWPIGRIEIKADQTFESWMMRQHNQIRSEPCCAYTAGVLVGFVNILSGRKDVVCIEHTCQGSGDPSCYFELIPEVEAQDQAAVSFSPDPGLGRQLNLLEMLFDRMPMGIAVLDDEYQILRFNPTWKEFSNRYAPPHGASLVPGVGYFEHIPGSESTIQPLFERTLAGETIRRDSLRLEAGGIVSYWDVALTPLVEDQNITGILVVSIDATERVQVQHDLQESQRTLSTLISNLPGMAYRCRNDRTWSMDFVSQGCQELTGYSSEELTRGGSIEYGDLIHPEDKNRVWEQVQAAIRADQPFQIQYRIQARSSEKWVWEQGQAIRDQNGEVLALEGFINDITERIQSHQDLERRVTERTKQLSTLLDFSHNLALTLELEELLDLILDQLGEVVSYDAASIMILEKDVLKITAYRGPIPREQALEIQFTLGEARANQQVIQSHEPLIIDDIYGPDPLAKVIRETAGEDLESVFSYLKCWMGVPLIVKDQVIGMLSLDQGTPGSFDTAQAKLAQVFANQAAVAIENARLYSESERRAEESEALFTVQQAITSKLELDEVLQMIADQARSQTNTDLSAVYLLKGNELEISYVSGDVSPEIIGYRLSLDDSLAGYVVRNKRAVLVPDTREDPRVDRTAAEKVGARSLLVVPLIAAEKTIGTITVANNRTGGFTPEDERLLTQLAANVVISVENAQLYQAEQNRRQVAESMRDIIGLINANLDLESFLDRAVELAANRLSAGGCVLHEFDLERQTLLHRASFGLEGIFKKSDSRPFLMIDVSGGREYLEATLDHRPTFTNYGPLPERVKVIQNDNSLPERVKAERIALREKFAGSFSVPLIIQDQVYGGMVFYYSQPQEFSEQQIELGMTFAEQVALAIENAHLFEETEESAVAGERDRLARDLHDAVTQTLFSTSLIAEVLPAIWEKDPQQGWERLEEIRTLTRGALAEMRSLLMELRPTALEETAIADLLQQLQEAFVGRTGVPAEIIIQGDCAFPVDHKVTIYRVAQEALNNIAKHARATSCQISLNCMENGFSLRVRDDGEGFDPRVTASNSLGLGIMQDRADGIGARLMVNSEQGQGTEVRLDWDKPKG